MRRTLSSIDVDPGSGTGQLPGCERGALLREPRERGSILKEPRERGSMAVELVLLAPVMVAFLLLVVAGGRYVAVRGDVEAASRDAVRAASLERSPGAAARAANRTAGAALTGRWRCSDARLDGAFVAGGTIGVDLECRVPLGGLGLIGLPGSVTVHGRSQAPLDVFRRIG